MKKVCYAFLSLLLLSALYACNNEEPANTTDERNENEQVLVSLKLGGEMTVSQGEEELSRGTATNDIYGINVYYDKANDGNYVIYGYGLFDNEEDMTISLLSGYKYKFECTLVKDGKNTLYYGQAWENTYSGFAYPFQTAVKTSTMLGNKFITGTSTYLTGIKSGTAHLVGNTPTNSYALYGATSFASVNRFYGETSGYIPTDGGTVTIDLKRVVFGAKFIVTGVKEGTLTATCGDFWKQTLTADHTGTPTLYTFADVYACWASENPYTATYTLTLSYVSDRGSDWNMNKTYDITFKRNVLTTVNITINPDLSSGSFVLNEEAMGGENNINIGINADNQIDTNVDPNENE